MEFRNVDTVRLGGGKIVAGFSNGPRQSATRRNNPEDTILHSHRRENLKSYIIEGYYKIAEFYLKGLSTNMMTLA
jgi:hypothetical protein